jgi:small subunit ribosomal protein S6
MRNYDLTFVVASDVSEDELNGVVAQVQAWIEEVKGRVEAVDHWGRRRLAYSIHSGLHSYNEGYYVSFDCFLEPQGMSELERNLIIYSRVLRYLLIRRGE